MAGVIHQQVQLSREIAAADAVHIPQVGLIHSDQQVELIIVGVGELPGRLARTVDAVLRQLPPGRGIDRVADLLRAGGGGLNVEWLSSPAFFTRSFITNSAMGLRQILPWQTKSILVIS